MNKNSIIRLCEKYKERQDALNKLLEYPEFNVDYRFSKRYLDELNSLNKILDLYESYEISEDDNYLSQIEAYLLKDNFDEYLGITITFDKYDGYLYPLFKQNFINGGYKVAEANNTLIIKGVNLYCLYKKESGLHQIIKDSLKSDIFVQVLPIIDYDTALRDSDIEIDVFHSQGAGGQNINKVETAIRIKHIPTGIVVTCQDERSQLQNKEKALNILQDKIIQYYDFMNTQTLEKLKISTKKEYVRKYNLDSKYIEDLRLNKEFPLDTSIQDIASEILLNGRC